MLFCKHHTFFCNFHTFCTSWPPKISRQTSVQTWSAQFDLLPFWIVSKHIFASLKIFAITEFQTLQSFHLWKKKFILHFFKKKKKKKKKKPLIYWMTLIYRSRKLKSVVLEWHILINKVLLHILINKVLLHILINKVLLHILINSVLLY